MPRVENARVEQRSLAGPLVAELKKQVEQSAQPQWIGYAYRKSPAIEKFVARMAANRGETASAESAGWRRRPRHEHDVAQQ